MRSFCTAAACGDFRMHLARQRVGAGDSGSYLFLRTCLGIDVGVNGTHLDDFKAQNQPRRRKNASISPATAIIISHTERYPNGQLSSGMFQGPALRSKFMPYTPTMNVSGMNIVAITVSNRMTSFMRLLTLDR